MKTDVQFELSKILRSCIDLKKKPLWITKQISLQYLFLAILTMADPILYSFRTNYQSQEIPHWFY